MSTIEQRYGVMEKVIVVYADKQKRIQRPEFTGTHSKKEALDFIYFNQPINIIAIRYE